jgi:hypothetical protein
MKRLAPLQTDSLGRVFSLSFVAVTILWAVTSLLTLGDIYISWPLFAINLAISAALAYPLYRYRYHTVLAYDTDGFELQRGRLRIVGQWREFSRVSLLHLGSGRFAVRLYRDESEQPVELPASALRLDPWGFRFEVLDLLDRPRRAEVDKEEG